MDSRSQAIHERSAEQSTNQKPEYRTRILWINVIFFIVLHVIALQGIYVAFAVLQWKTILFGFIYGVFSGFGITAGCHRLWSHRSYKAKFSLRLFLCALCCIAGQNDIYDWCRNHRVHHKFTETDADPHNIKRGFFFAHMGWLMCKKHPDVAIKGKTVNTDDLLADPIIRYQRKFYIPLFVLFSFYLPAMIPVWFWGEPVWMAFTYCGILRYCISLHSTWCVNSVAHCYGDKPYDKNIEARQNTFVSFITSGEGWHNYHHVFPWDYSTSELGYKFNLTKVFIDFMALIGQAYDLKTAQPDSVYRKKLKAAGVTQMNITNDTKLESSE